MKNHEVGSLNIQKGAQPLSNKTTKSILNIYHTPLEIKVDTPQDKWYNLNG